LILLHYAIVLLFDILFRHYCRHALLPLILRQSHADAAADFSADADSRRLPPAIFLFAFLSPLLFRH